MESKASEKPKEDVNGNSNGKHDASDDDLEIVTEPSEASKKRKRPSESVEDLPQKIKQIRTTEDDDDLVVSSSGLSIWKKWVSGELYTDLTCCLSVVKDANFNDLIETVSGASAVLFLACDSIPWNLQKAQLLILS